MRLAVLTTDTPHHNYFIRQMMHCCDQLFVVYETTAIAPTYPTYHQFEDARITFEEELWGFECISIGSTEVDRLIHLPNINDIIHLQSFPNADACIVFGTRKIGVQTIGLLPAVTVNLHGGDPRLYRGLDSHLWALWHRDKSGLKTCLHYLSAELDTGAIISMRNLNISQINHLYELRALNTAACIELCQEFLLCLARGETMQAVPQEYLGRYYSFMPAELKDIVFIRFNLRASQSEI